MRQRLRWPSLSGEIPSDRVVDDLLIYVEIKEIDGDILRTPLAVVDRDGTVVRVILPRQP